MLIFNRLDYTAVYVYSYNSIRYTELRLVYQVPVGLNPWLVLLRDVLLVLILA